MAVTWGREREKKMRSTGNAAADCSTQEGKKKNRAHHPPQSAVASSLLLSIAATATAHNNNKHCCWWCRRGIERTKNILSNDDDDDVEHDSGFSWWGNSLLYAGRSGARAISYSTVDIDLQPATPVRHCSECVKVKKVT